MPRPQRPWFRFYVEALHDPKLRDRPAAQRWVWLAILGAARRSPISGFLMASESRPLTTAGIADLAAVPEREVKRALEWMAADGMVELDEELGAWRVTNWAERQYESDDVTARTRRHRKGATLERSNGVPGNSDGTFPGTPPETETDIPTSSSDSRGHAPDPDDDVIAAACKRLAETEADHHADITNRTAWVRSRAATLRKDHAPEAARVLAQHPDLEAPLLARYLAGERAVIDPSRRWLPGTGWVEAL